MQKLLITFGTRPLAQRLAKQFEGTFQILFSSSEEVPAFMQANYAKIPTGANPTFAHELLKLGLDKQVDYLLPLGWSEIQALAEAKLLFEEYDINLLIPDKEALQDLFLLQNPNPSVPLEIYANGKGLTTQNVLPTPQTGLFALADDAEDIALCTI